MLAVVACLLALAAANISLRAAWHELEDGVLWVARPDGVAAAEVASRGPGDAAGIRPGDILLAINGRPVESTDAVLAALHGGVAGQALEYTVLGNGTRGLKRVALQPVPQGHRALYFVLAAVAIFTLIVGAAVRVSRPGDPATLHFFWLSVAFFGVFAFSFSGRLDRLDWTFYWADVVAMAALPPMFLHFALSFPERSQAWIHSEAGRRIWPLFYAPAALLVASRVAAISGAFGNDPSLSRLLASLDRLELVHLGIGLVAGFAVMAVALRRARSVTARRQLRWIVWGTALGAIPFVVAYVVPYVLGWNLLSRVELLALPLGLVPLAFASAVVRYRLMDVEVIFKRGIVYATLGSAMIAIYAVTLKLATEVFLGGSDEHLTVIAVLATLVAVLLAPVVKNAVQATFDRAYYRDRYDYRRALVAFARDLNSDLDLERLATKLVERVRQTLALERMALLITPVGGTDYWVVLRAEGFDADALLRLDASGGVGGRVQQGHAVSFDDPLTARRFSSDEVHRWRDVGVHVFLPCVSKEGTIAVMALGPKETGEPLNSEDMTLLNAVAGQVATAIENGRLYHQLRVKADELNRLRQFSENIIASLTDGLIVVGLDDRVVRWNAAMEGLYGVSRTAAVGQPLEALFDGPFVAALKSARAAQDEVGTAFRVPLTSRHGEPRLLLVNAAATPLRTPDGAVAGTIVIVEDTTARVKLEEQLQISDKMASIGLLAAGVAHEVNTPLTGISSYTQMLLDGIAPDDPRAPLLEKIERQTFRAAKIVNGLLNFARPSQAESGPVDLHTVINDVLSLLEHQLRGGSIQLRKDLAPESPVVMGVEHKLQQVFINLFLNARDAMPSGGWLSIGTHLDDDVAVVEVSDTGQGIPTDQLARIYDPFFTTKAIGQGTGLGLSITYGIVQEHRGTIACDSRAGQGTKFILRLPLAVAARERVGQAAK
jgi:PAS domain S-box-containing protein